MLSGAKVKLVTVMMHYCMVPISCSTARPKPSGNFFIHGNVTKSLLACAFLPLLKSLKDSAKTDSYRAIAGSSLILKLMDNVILLLWGVTPCNLALNPKYPQPNVHGLWMKYQCTMSRQAQRSSPRCLIVAYDKCQCVPLFEKLLKRNLPPVIVRILIYVYKEQESWVRWGPLRSETFRISNRTHQGSVLSPALFAV